MCRHGTANWLKSVGEEVGMMFMMLMVVRKTVIGNRMTLESICKTKDGGDNFEPGALLPVPPPRHHPLPHNHPSSLPHRHLLLLEDSLQVIGPSEYDYSTFSNTIRPPSLSSNFHDFITSSSVFKMSLFVIQVLLWQKEQIKD